MTNRIFAAAVLVLLATITTVTASGRGGWTSAQLEELRSMSLAELEPLPRDPTNRVADDPRAADLGRRLFFDTRLSANGRVACSTCHQADRGFQDGIALANGVGTTAQAHDADRRHGAIARFCSGMAGKTASGRRHSVPSKVRLSTVARARSTRTSSPTPTLRSTSRSSGRCRISPACARSAGPVAERDAASAWSALSSGQRDDVTRVFVNIGKAIAAYERRIEFGASRFDKYVAALTTGQPGREHPDGRRNRGLAAVHRQGELHAVPQRTPVHQQ